MATDKTDIFIYADWLDTSAEFTLTKEVLSTRSKDPKLIGILSAHHGKIRKTFSFKFVSNWLTTEKPFLFDPDISWNEGNQFPTFGN